MVVFVFCLKTMSEYLFPKISYGNCFVAGRNKMDFTLYHLDKPIEIILKDLFQFYVLRVSLHILYVVNFL